jgi:hypothetical protein
MARRGRSSSGRSSRGRSSSRSRGRSSSRSSKSRSSSRSRAISTSSRSKSRATSSKRTPTRRTTRTRTTTSAPRRTYAVSTTRATPRRVNVRPVYVNRATAATVKPRLTGGRIAPPMRSDRQFRTRQDPRVVTLGNVMTRGRPVNVTFANGKTRRMSLSPNAIRTYQRSGLKVTPVSFTIRDGVRFPTPAIPRITNPSIAWSKRPPKQLHVTPHQVAPPHTKNLESFGGTGANPWNPFEALGGLFGMPPQQNPQTQYMPQEQKNIINPDRPVYTSFASGAHQAAAFEQSRAGFNSNIMGTGAQAPTSFDAKQEIQNLLSNKYALYAGLALGGLVLVKMISGGGAPRGYYR